MSAFNISLLILASLFTLTGGQKGAPDAVPIVTSHGNQFWIGTPGAEPEWTQAYTLTDNQCLEDEPGWTQFWTDIQSTPKSYCLHQYKGPTCTCEITLQTVSSDKNEWAIEGGFGSYRLEEGACPEIDTCPARP